MINGIPTYLIGCDELPERKKFAFEHLQSHGVDFKYWRGLYGRTSGLMTTIIHNYWPDGRPYYISPGIASLTLNHLFLYQHCLLNNYDQVVVLEDDVHLEDEWREKMTSMMRFLPQDYDMVYLGWCHEGQGRSFKHVASYLYNDVNGCVYGTHAMLISKKGLKILIDHNRILERPIDVQICLWSLPLMKYYVCYPNLISQRSQWKEKDRMWVTSL